MSDVLVLAAAAEKEARRTLWINDVGLVVEARHYMSLERLYRVAFEQNMRCMGTTVALVPDYFNPDLDGEWQFMTEDEYEQYIDFSVEKLQLHHVVEFKLKEIEEAPLLYCIAGCSHDCTRKFGERGQLLPPALFNVYYLRVGAQLITIVVSCKPTEPAGDGYRDHGGRFVITEVAFGARKTSLVALQKWHLKRAVLRQFELPHIIAGPQPELQEVQENFDPAYFPDQQCGAVGVGVNSQMLADFMRVQPVPVLPMEPAEPLSPPSSSDDEEIDNAEIDVMIARQLRLHDARQPGFQVEHRYARRPSASSSGCGSLSPRSCEDCPSGVTSDCLAVVRRGGYCSLVSHGAQCCDH